MAISGNFQWTEKRDVIVLALLLGFVSIATQIIMLREFLSFFYGNEFILGMILAVWMMLTGLGAYLGRSADKVRNRLSLSLILLVVISFLPFILVFLLYFLRNYLFLPGEVIQIFEVLITSFVVLLPFCLLSGFVFTLLCNLFACSFYKDTISKTYAWESVGSIAGGLVFNLLLIWWLETFYALLFLILLGSGIVLFLALRFKKWIPGVFGLLVVVVFILFTWQKKPDLFTSKYLYYNQEVVHAKSTPYGNITVTKTGEQLNFFENNVLLFSSAQSVQSEEAVHYTLIHHDNPEHILLLSAGLPGIIEETLKYNPQLVDYVEINPWLVRVLKKYSGVYEMEKVRVIEEDARIFVEQTSQKYDAVIIGVPEPSTIQLNRFYTAEFYSKLKTILKKDAVIGFNLSGASNYLSDETLQLYSSLYQTLEQSFQNVLIVPGAENYFIASDRELSYNIPHKIEEKKIITQYVNKYYIQEDLLKRRGEIIESQLVTSVRVNRDYKPVTYALKIKQWLSQFQVNYWIPLLALMMILMYLVFSVHPVNRSMLVAGFTGASLEIILLVAFQILFGNVFQMVGVIITIFMTGLAVGSYYRHLCFKIRAVSFYRAQSYLAIWLFIISVFLTVSNKVYLNHQFLQFLLGVFMFISAALVGIIFSIASQLRIKKVIMTAAEIYSLDLIGAAIGSFIVSVYLIPLLGLITTGFVIGGFTLIITLISYFQFNSVRI